MSAAPEIPPPVSSEDVVALLSDLVAIPSVNPLHGDETTAPYGEAALGAFVASYARGLGLTAESQPALPGRANILVRLPGASTLPPLLLECHLDTVPGWDGEPNPFHPRVADGRLYGRGACDVKGTLAAMLLALRQIVRAGETPFRGVVLAATVDEEHRARGVHALATSGERFGAAIVGEPTELAIVVAHKGCIRWRLTTRGRSVHSSKAELGQNAVEDMIDILADVRRDLLPRLAERRHPSLGPPTLTIGTCHGGDAVNVVPDLCVVEIDRRMVPGETAEEVDAELRAAVDRACRQVPRTRIEISAPFVAESPVETPPDAAIVRELTRAIQRQGIPARQLAVPYGTDASALQAVGVPSVVFGPGTIDVAHTREESVEVSQVVQAAEILATLIRLGPEKS
ncbi:MAG TPA: M20 family metallopeptidase [Chloroflexota bacterium]|nr:M20 family metallopeptidase [Chloroflexota bacterium]